MKKWAQQAALHYAVVNILKAIVLLVLLSHWLGCGFLALLRSDPHASEWMPQPCYASASDQYICGIYWAFGTLTSNVRPHSQAIQKVYDRTSFSESTSLVMTDLLRTPLWSPASAHNPGVVWRSPALRIYPLQPRVHTLKFGSRCIDPPGAYGQLGRVYGTQGSAVGPATEGSDVVS